uniref:Tonsoku-like protein n=1 Tax=Phallusia mammillata TaxID=59560 RepID=A0A6F9DUP1_9ASCI|nr:tonsoku-like protein [Phallusia mammillata]
MKWGFPTLRQLGLGICDCFRQSFVLRKVRFVKMDKAQLKEIKRCERLRIKAQESKHLKEESEWCNALGNLYLQAGDYDEALNMHKQELALCRSLQDVVGEAVANRKIGDVYLSMENYSLAISHHKKHLELAFDDKVEMQRANTSLGQTYLEQARSMTSPTKITEALKKSIDLLTESLQLTTELTDDDKVPSKELNEMRIRSFINLGLCHHQLSCAVTGEEKATVSARSAEYFQKAILLAQKCNASEELYLVNRIVCDVNLDQKQVSAALHKAESALRIAKSSGIKQKIFESLNLCAQIYLLLENVDGAKKCLKKSYKIKTMSGINIVEEKLKAVLKMCKLQGELSCEDIEVDRLFKLHELMADLFCKVDCYLPAVKHYKKQEDLLDKVTYCSSRHRAVVYFSIASTLMDAGEYPEAIAYFLKEMSSNEDKTERAKTHTHVATCYEKMGNPYDEVKSHYDKALECAKEVENGRLELQTLMALEKTQLNYEMRKEASETGAKIAALEAKLGLFADDVEDSQDTCQNSCPLDDSEELLREEMEKISDDDSDTEEGPRKRRKANLTKKNEKGETPLHRACIEGHVMRVKLLLEQGHPLNPRDFCDWTPLHEACNHGYHDIVALLLSNGANVNAVGGQQCDAITPIQDAALNGHFSIVSMLLEKGADPNIQDARGKTTLNNLTSYYHLHKDDMDPSSKQEYKQLYAILKQREGEKKTPGTFSANFAANNLNMDLAKLAEDDNFPMDSEPIAPPNDDFCMEEHSDLPVLSQREFSRPKRNSIQDSISDYRDSIAALGSSNNLLTATQSQRNSTKRTSNASSLMDVNEPDADDWLVEDVIDDDAPFRQPMKKPRRLEVTKWEKPSSAAKRGWKRKTPKITDFCKKSSQIEVAFDAVDLTDDEISQSSPNVTQLPPSSSPLPSTPTATTVSALRVKVKVKETTFLVGVPGRNKPVSWLEERAASLYENMTKLRPKLSLFTCDGARLLPDDQLCDVISSNDVIVAKEDVWNVLPFAQRYVEMCRNSGLKVVPRILSACQECESSTVLEIKNYAYNFSSLNPMLATLRQPEVTRLLFPGNGVSDDGVQCLCGAMTQSMTSQSSETSVAELNLACNNVSDAGLRKLSKCLAFRDLTNLNLSYNPLRGGEGLLQLLTNVHNLHVLNISHCYLTNGIFKNNEMQRTLQKALRNLRELDISENDFGSSCVQNWFGALDRNVIDILNLSSIADQTDNSNLTLYLEKFLRKGETKISAIDITYNSLQEKHITSLRPLLHLVGTLYVSG